MQISRNHCASSSQTESIQKILVVMVIACKHSKEWLTKLKNLPVVNVNFWFFKWVEKQQP